MRRVNVVRAATPCLVVACLLAVLVPGLAQKRTQLARASPESSQLEGDRALVINTDLVTFTVTVTDREGHNVSGLDRSAFSVLDEGVLQEISFFSDEDAPVSVGVIFDTSGSMSGKKIARARQALAQFIQTSHPMDEYFLIGFSSKAQLLSDRTRDADALLKKLTYVEPHGQTALYDAVYLGIEKATRGVYPKRVLLIISDGQDNNSRYGYSELRRSLAESGVIVYAVGIEVRSLPKTTQSGEATLKGLASRTGGKAFFPDNAEEMTEAFDRIALELRHQYSIGYRPKDFSGEGRWHKLKVKLRQPSGTQPRLLVRSREGYFAVGNHR